MSKAITLPVNILVIVAIAVIVLMGLIAIYGVGFNPFSSAINLESIKNVACRKISFAACKLNANDITVNYDANKDGATDNSDTFLELCKNFFGRSDELSCKQLCGCVGTTVSGGGGGCTESWSCPDWSTVSCISGIKTRACTDANNCGTTYNRPSLSQSCGGGGTCTCNWVVQGNGVSDCNRADGRHGCYSYCRCSTSGCGTTSGVQCLDSDGVMYFPEGTINHCQVC